MKINTKYLYDLLPAYYRLLDDQQGNSLQALVDILAREGGIVEEHIARLYENWFVETCDEWVIPYIADLLGVRTIHEAGRDAFSRRAYVANTLAYRRRKGTLPVIEQLALDVTGWRSKAVEFFQLLAATQYMNHVRLHCKATPDLRAMEALDLINTAFDSLSHTVDTGRISTGLGRYNIQNIGIFLWRLQSYRLVNGTAREMVPDAGIPEGAYTFSPLGLDMQLFNNPQTENDIVDLAEEINVPGLLRRRALHDELEEARTAIANENEPVFRYFRMEYPPVCQLFINGSGTPVPPEEIAICNLSDWRVPPDSKVYRKIAKDAGGDAMAMDMALPIKAAIDPVLGRIVFSDPDSISSDVLVRYSYGFSGDIGGGTYDRRSSLNAEEVVFDWHVGVSQEHGSVQSETIYQTLGEAIDDWNAQGGAIKTGLITMMDNRSYDESAGHHPVILGEGKQLYIIAADWPVSERDGVPERSQGSLNPAGLRPHILMDMEVAGTAAVGSAAQSGLTINGLLIEGKVTIQEGNLSHCHIQHCTLVPGKGGFEVKSQQGLSRVSISQSICGAVDVVAEGAMVSLEESIIDHKEAVAIHVPNGQLDIQKCTIFGRVEARLLDACSSIFNERATILRRQKGCVRFSYLTLGSKTPRRYRCQPELEIKRQISERKKRGALSVAEKQAIKDRVLSWLLPSYNSRSYGHHTYCQLAGTTPAAIITGAGNAAEMGVFNYLQQPQREANLRIVLEEYMRLGLEAGIIYVS